ncbi:hypothetical protein PsYK624_101550 [Phanerochaete sordida]|uniref:Uncharacterized protein n=1 Tax=Phanerochaete sordida TaxID=48140 RepID=A0A9P3LGN4_9APHY|nr:hypothetical protein PsYK624_101550 [Phanerochaete sordida]
MYHKGRLACVCEQLLVYLRVTNLTQPCRRAVFGIVHIGGPEVGKLSSRAGSEDNLLNPQALCVLGGSLASSLTMPASQRVPIHALCPLPIILRTVDPAQ